MKKMILMLLALVLAMTNVLAFAEEAPETTEPVVIGGFVMDVTDESILILNDGQYIEALLNEETLIDGSDVAIGDYMFITYNGMMTRSLPAQITAMAIGNYKLMGLVSEITEEGFTLTFGEDVYGVIATADQLAGIQDGMFVTVYHTGRMTRSIPAQVVAAHIRGQEILGTVVEMAEGGFILTVDGEELPYHVSIKENALQFVPAEPGMEVIVIVDGLMTASLENILVNASEILPLNTVAEVYDLAGIITEITEEYLLILGADGQEYQINIGEDTIHEGKEIAVGDFIHVTHNGQMTMSIPAQVFGLKIGCYAFQGVVSDMVDGQFTLTTENDVILVNVTAEQAAELKDGATVVVYSNGAMTMSLPAQIGAELIVQLSR